MESFNDSNTSEFDCAEWDSRQDTSLDYCSVKATPEAERPVKESPSSPDRSDHSGDTVMDADLRHSNRLNLELLVLQNATQNVLSGAYGHRASFAGRSKSLSGGGTSFPQSGILPTASEFNQLPHGDHLLMQRQLSDNVSALSEAGKSRTNSEHDSGIADQLVESSSRKSSLFAAQPSPSAPFGAAPSIRLIVKPLQQQQQQQPEADTEDAAEAGESKRSILNTLASIGRSASRSSDSSETAGSQPEPEPEQLYEVQLVELRNMLAGRRPTLSGPASGDSSQWQVGGAGGAAGCGPMRARSRRESLLGALVAATMPTSARRPSVEGVFARVFKHHEVGAQPQEPDKSPGSQRDASKRIKGDAAALFDSVSLNSGSSGSSANNPGGATPANADYIQMPLVKTPTQAVECGLPLSSAGISGAFSFIDSPVASAYRFVCRKSEFPLRVSLYQVSKRGGARYTIGHCFVNLGDCTAQQRPPVSPEASSNDINNVAGEQENQVKRLSSGSAASNLVADLDQQQSNSKLVLLSANCATNQQRQQPAHLEYRLYQTILEAIP